MKFNCIIIRFSELVLKSNPVRKRFQKILIRNIKNTFYKERIENKIISKRFGLILKTSDIEKSVSILKRVFGTISLSPAVDMQLSDMNAFFEKYSDSIARKGTFAVRVTREGRHEFNSRDIEKQIGSVIVEKTKKEVDLSNPDLTIYIDIRNDEVYVYFEKIKCCGGLPLSTGGRAICYIENRQDVVAAWFMMKRGCVPILCYKKPDKILDKWSCGVNLEKIKIKSENDLKKISKMHDIDVFVFGDSLKGNGLKNIKNRTKKFRNVFFPVIGFGSNEVEQLYKQINIKND